MKNISRSHGPGQAQAGVAGITPLTSALQPQQIVAISEAAADIPDVIPLWYGESDLPTPAFICEAAMESLRRGETFYPRKRGSPRLIESVDRWLHQTWGVAPGLDRITITSSGMLAIKTILEMILSPGENIVCIAPLWPNAEAVGRFLGAEVHNAPLDLDDQGRFSLDLDGILSAIDERTRAIFINTPNNPSGYVASREELDALLAETRKRGIWLLCDEVYGRITADGRPAPSLLPSLSPEDRAVVLHSFSKAWCMTGWRLGFMVHPPELGFHISELIELTCGGSPEFVQAGGKAALDGGESFIAFFNDYVRQGEKAVRSGLAEMSGVELMAPPPGAFYTFFRVPMSSADPVAFCVRMAREAGVGMAPGTAFGAYRGWLRLCHAQDPERLAKALDRLDGFFRKVS